MNQATFVIGAGGTAGHVVPAIAVADELRASGHQVVFIGGDRDEAILVPEAGYELRQIQVKGFSRSSKKDALKAGGMAFGAVRDARRFVKELKPAAVMGGGGYMAGVVGLAALSTRTPLVLTEADGHLGVSNRTLKNRAFRVCLGFPIEGMSPPQFVVTGRPVSPAWTDREKAREMFGLRPDEPCVLVFGGSLGALSINKAALAGLAGLQVGGDGAWSGKQLAVLHATGRRDFPQLSGSQPDDGHYHLHDYIKPLAAALCAADLVVSRSGGSIAEITLHGKPSILIPYPHAAGDHQTANARWLVDAEAALLEPDHELNAEGLRSLVSELLADPQRLQKMSEASAALAKPNAAREIAEQMIAAVQSRSAASDA